MVSIEGLGYMGMSCAYGAFDDEESLTVFIRAADLGITFWDTSDVYGPFTNEELLGRWFEQTGRRKEIFLATKFGKRFPGTAQLFVDCSPENVKKSCKASLERLRTDYIDLYYAHRIDHKVPIEHTVQAMAELQKEGKITYLGLSECSARTLRRACKAHQIAAVQMEYSPFALEIESEDIGVLKATREHDVKIVAYAPLGRGFLTGAIRSRADFADDDFRKYQPRFAEENFADNLNLVDTLASFAKAKGCTTGQLSLAWVLAQRHRELYFSFAFKPLSL